MEKSNENRLICNRCEEAVLEDDEFCPNCGIIFTENVFCTQHSRQLAEGVCVICTEAFCGRCGERVNDIFLCNRHQGYEIYQGMARVFGENDMSTVEYARKCLHENGLHPFIYNRKANPTSLGSTDYTLFRAAGGYDGQIINEVKLMVPCQEVLVAENLLRNLNIL